jgi:hypothetical protein
MEGKPEGRKKAREKKKLQCDSLDKSFGGPSISMRHKSSRVWRRVMFRTIIETPRRSPAQRISSLADDRLGHRHKRRWRSAHVCGLLRRRSGIRGRRRGMRRRRRNRHAGGCMRPCLRLRRCLRHHSLRLRARRHARRILLRPYRVCHDRRRWWLLLLLLLLSL